MPLPEGTLIASGTGTASFFTGGATSGVSSYNDAGTWRAFKSMFYMLNGNWTTIQSGWYNDKGTWRKFFGSTGIGPSALNVSVAPSSPASTHTTTTAGSTSQQFTATATNGTAPYTYQWTRVSSVGPGFTASGQTTSVLTLSQSWSANTASTTIEFWNCTVTDSLGNVVTSSPNSNYEVVLIAPSMSVSISGGGLHTYQAIFTGTFTFTNPLVATVSGGAQPYTYLWTFLSNPSDPSVNSGRNFFLSSTSVSNPSLGLIYVADGTNFAGFSQQACTVNVKVTDNQGNVVNAQATVTFRIIDSTFNPN